MATIRDCKKIQPLLSEYVDGYLPTETDWDVKLHVASCAVCAQAAQELTATANLLRNLPAREPSANFEAMLAKRLADTALKPRRESWLSWLSDRKENFAGLWRSPSMRPAFAVGVAAVVIAPFAFVASRPANIPLATQGTTPIVRATPGTPSDAAALDQLWREHSAYASSETLGDPAGMVSSGTL